MDASTVLLLPGWQDPGPGHWQNRWEARYGYRRVEQHDGGRPLQGDWIAQLEEVVLERAASSATQAEGGLLLAAHSLGCLLVAAWAACSRSVALVKGALLVAPVDPQREELGGLLTRWSPPVLQPLPFRSCLLASRDDPYCSLVRARAFATAWGCSLVDCGALGHLGAAAGLGDWPEGHQLLRSLATAVPQPDERKPPQWQARK